MIVLSSENMFFLLPRVPYACGNAFGTISEKLFFRFSEFFYEFLGHFFGSHLAGKPLYKIVFSDFGLCGVNIAIFFTILEKSDCFQIFSKPIFRNV